MPKSMEMTKIRAGAMPADRVTIAGPGQMPASPHPVPNRILPATRRLSIRVAAGSSTGLPSSEGDGAGHDECQRGIPVSGKVQKVQDFDRVGHTGKDQPGAKDQSGQKGDDIEHVRLPDSGGQSRR